MRVVILGPLAYIPGVMDRLKKLLPMIIGAVILALYLKSVDYRAMWDSLQNVQYLWVVPILAANIGSLYTRAMRWRIFLWSVKPLPPGQLFVTQSVGFFAILAVPARMGEVVKAFLVHKKDGVPFGAGMATVLLERIFDLIAVLLMLVWVLIYVPFPDVAVPGTEIPLPDFVQNTGRAFAVLCAGMVLFIVGLAFIPRPVHRVTEFFCRFLPGLVGEKITGLMHSFEEGLAVLKRPSQLLWSVVWTVGTWACIVSTEYMLFRAFGLPYGIGGAVTLCAILALAVAVPGLPGFVGVFQVACVIVVHHLFGAPRGVGDAYGNMLWMVQVVPILLLGYVLLVRVGLSFSRLRHVGEEMEETIHKDTVR